MSYKWSSTPVTSAHTLHRATTTITHNDERTEEQKGKQRFLDMQSARTYCVGAQYDKIVTYAYYSLQESCNFCHKYIHVRVSESEFLVTRNLCDFPYKKLTHIPRFKRVRKVSLFNGNLTCNCTLSTTFGLLCPHVLCVKRITDESYIPT